MRLSVLLTTTDVSMAPAILVSPLIGALPPHNFDALKCDACLLLLAVLFQTESLVVDRVGLSFAVTEKASEESRLECR